MRKTAITVGLAVATIMSVMLLTNGIAWTITMEVGDTSMELLRRDNDVAFLRSFGVEAAPGITASAARREVRKLMDQLDRDKRPYVSATRPSQVVEAQK